MPVLNEIGQLLCSQRLELLLDLAEDELDGVQLALVNYIEYRPDVELPHPLPGPDRPVRCQVVHEER